MSRSELYRKYNQYVTLLGQEKYKAKWKLSTVDNLTKKLAGLETRVRQYSRITNPEYDFDVIIRQITNKLFIKMVKIENALNIQSNINANNNDDVFEKRITKMYNDAVKLTEKPVIKLEFIDTRAVVVDNKNRLKDTHMNVSNLFNENQYSQENIKVIIDNSFENLINLTSHITVAKLRKEIENFGSIKVNIGIHANMKMYDIQTGEVVNEHRISLNYKGHIFHRKTSDTQLMNGVIEAYIWFQE